MFPLEANGVKPHPEVIMESWHQALPRPPTTFHSPDKYKWDNINALFDDQVQVVTSFNPSIDDSAAGTSKPNKRPLLRFNINLKRLHKAKPSGKRLFRSASDSEVSSKGNKMSLMLGKYGSPKKHLLTKKLKKAIKNKLANKTQK